MHELIKWCNQNGGFLSALLTFAYVAATIWLVSLARRQLRLATDLERSRTRPFVVLDLLTEHHSVFARIKNLGQTPARNVRIEVNPAVRALFGGEHERPREERDEPIAFIERGIAMMPPGRVINALVAHWARFRSHYQDLRFEGKVTYEDASGVAYSEPFVIDLSAEQGIYSIRRMDLHDIGEELQKIGRTLELIASGFHKPLVRVLPEETYQEQQRTFAEEARRRLEQRESETPPNA